MKKILLIFVFFVFSFVTSCAPVTATVYETSSNDDLGICDLVGRSSVHGLYRCIDSHAVCYLFGDDIECFDILGK